MKILGQPHVDRYLTQGLKTHRLSPSLLFVGPDGVGKRTAARELAESLSQGSRADVLYVDRAFQASLLKEKPETQTAIKIETVRLIDKFLHLKPAEGRKRTAIIDEAHRLTIEAANALLKLLEEPPVGAQLVLVCRNEKKLPSTVLSRCAILRFRPIPAADIAGWLTQHKNIPAEKAAALALRAEGSLAKALAGLEEGDLSQLPRLRRLLRARRQLDAHVSPRLLLEDLFLKLHPVARR